MTLANPPLNKAERAITETIRTSWAPFLVQGSIMMVLGAVAVIWPQISTLAADLYVGWVFLFSGLIGLVSMFIAPSASAFLWSLLTAALSLLVGVLLLWHPVEGAVTLTLLLVGFFIVEGIFQIAGAIQHRDAFPGTWGWLLMSGVADLLLTAMIIFGMAGNCELGARAVRWHKPHHVGLGDHYGGFSGSQDGRYGGKRHPLTRTDIFREDGRANASGKDEDARQIATLKRSTQSTVSLTEGELS